MMVAASAQMKRVGEVAGTHFNLTFYDILDVSENVTELWIKMYGECYEDVDSFKSSLSSDLFCFSLTAQNLLAVSLSYLH